MLQWSREYRLSRSGQRTWALDQRARADGRALLSPEKVPRKLGCSAASGVIDQDSMASQQCLMPQRRT